MTVRELDGRTYVGTPPQEVTDVTDRQLCLLAADTSLDARHAVTALDRRVGLLEEAEGRVATELAGLATAVRSALGIAHAARDAAPSAHEIAAQVAEEITSPGMRLPTASDRVREIARQEHEREELRESRERDTARRALVAAVIASVSGGVVVEALNLLFHR